MIAPLRLAGLFRGTPLPASAWGTRLDPGLVCSKPRREIDQSEGCVGRSSLSSQFLKHTSPSPLHHVLLLDVPPFTLSCSCPLPILISPGPSSTTLPIYPAFTSLPILPHLTVLPYDLFPPAFSPFFPSTSRCSYQPPALRLPRHPPTPSRPSSRVTAAAGSAEGYVFPESDVNHEHS